MFYQKNIKLLHNLNFSRSINGDTSVGGSASRAVRLNLLDNIESVSDLTEHNVLAVEPGAGDGGDEELGAVGIGTSVGHGQKTGSVMSLDKVFIGKLVAVDGHSTRSILSGEVTALEHKLRDDSVEDGFGVSKSLFAGSEGPEVLGSLGGHIIVELEGDSAKGLAWLEDDLRIYTKKMH